MAKKPNLAGHLRAARQQRGISAAQLAEMIGVSVPSIYFWETGRHCPRSENLTALCKALRLPIRATREMAAG